MRKVLSGLGRAVSVATVVVLLAVPTSQGATFLLDRDGGSGPVLGPAHRIIHALKKWFATGIADDELIIPRP
jgi:hypothetical protein